MGSDYLAWLVAHEPTKDQLQAMRRASDLWTDAPLVSVVMVVRDTDARGLEQTIASVAAQAYQRWELCAGMDISMHRRARDVLESWAAREPRVRIVSLDSSSGLADGRNRALRNARGDMIAFVNEGDVVRPHALWEVVRHLRVHPEEGAVYSDEDRSLSNGHRSRPYFKGDFSADLLLSTNYVGHLLVARRQVVDDVGGWRLGVDGAEDYDLVLRLSERTSIGHVAAVLYTVARVFTTTTRSDGPCDPDSVAMKAIDESLERRGAAAHASPGHVPGYYHVRHELHERPRVSLIIPTRNRSDLLRACLSSIDQLTDYDNYEIVVVDNSSDEPETLEYLASLQHRVLVDPDEFNYSRIMNRAVAQTDSKYLVLLNNDIEVRSPEWLTAMLEQGQRSDVGAVGARLLFPNGGVQHEGIRIGSGVIARNLDLGGYFALGRCIRDVSAATAACLLVRRSVYDQVAGFDEQLRVVFNDVDFCLRIRQAGYRIVYQPLAELTHHELASRGHLDPPEDIARFVERWGPPDTLTDPFVSPHIAGFNPLTLKW